VELVGRPVVSRIRAEGKIFESLKGQVIFLFSENVPTRYGDHPTFYPVVSGVK
jgi:hypothetical protein